MFQDYHALTYELYQNGIITGLRIDHIDGLKNPKEYVDRLRAMFGNDCYIIVEKILDIKEELPPMDIQGTSGYEFLSYINQLITDTEGSQKLLKTYNSYVPEWSDYDKIVFDNKLANLETYLNGEWDNLLRYLLSLNLIEDEEIRIKELKMALGAFMAAYPVYRAYIGQFPLTDNDQQLVALAFEEALNKILSLHDDFEHGDAWGPLLEQPDALLDSVRKFVLALDEFHADVEVDAFATNGDRSHSSLTKRGRADAIKFFAHREKLVDDQIIAGNVRGLSDAGWIEVASQGTRGKRRIKDVPSDLLDSGQLAFGRYVRIKVSEQTAPQKKTIYRFKELLTPDDIGSD
ncbi:MAG: hypothetical protein EON58_10295 [Alphaproteobacteria bacterium]|nr:MAG: hypothetical protein EON58_10295 [Alphaproteobacteria bacterium]